MTSFWILYTRKSEYYIIKNQKKSRVSCLNLSSLLAVSSLMNHSSLLREGVKKHIFLAHGKLKPPPPLYFTILLIFNRFRFRVWNVRFWIKTVLQKMIFIYQNILRFLMFCVPNNILLAARGRPPPLSPLTVMSAQNMFFVCTSSLSGGRM